MYDISGVVGGPGVQPPGLQILQELLTPLQSGARLVAESWSVRLNRLSPYWIPEEQLLVTCYLHMHRLYLIQSFRGPALQSQS